MTETNSNRGEPIKSEQYGIRSKEGENKVKEQKGRDMISWHPKRRQTPTAEAINSRDQQERVLISGSSLLLVPGVPCSDIVFSCVLSVFQNRKSFPFCQYLVPLSHPSFAEVSNHVAYHAAYHVSSV